MRPRPLSLLALVWSCLAGLSAQADMLYVSNYDSNTVSQITSAGVVSTYATTGINNNGLAFDAAGNLFTSHYNQGTILKTTPGGGSTSLFASGVSFVDALAFDRAGNLYASPIDGNSIYRYTPDGQRTNFATIGGRPTGLAFDSAGNLYAASNTSNAIYKVTTVGVVSVFASGGGLNTPLGLAFDSAGNLFVANQGGSISRITTAGSVSSFASGGLLSGYDYGLAIDSSDNIFVSNYSRGTILKVGQDASVSLFASGLQGPAYLTFQAAAVPEPSSLALCGVAGLVGLAWAGHRRAAAGMALS